MHKKLWFFLFIVFVQMFIIHSTISEKNATKKGFNKSQYFNFFIHQKERLKSLLKELLCSDEAKEVADNIMKNQKKFLDEIFAQKSDMKKFFFNDKQKIINLSNAAPCNIGEESEGSGRWTTSQGSGGLVTCVEPVLATTNNGRNVWIFSHVINESVKKSKIAYSLKKFLSSKCKNRGYKMYPIFVPKNEYAAYYEEISNGLLWPGLHNMPNYIREDYKNTDEKNIHLRTDEAFAAYVRVNFKFAVEALRRKSNSRDFIWVHDYHLMLVGLAISTMTGGTVETGFFLHIPFQPPAIAKYPRIAKAIFRGMLAFSKIGFQTHRDRDKFLEMINEHFAKEIDVISGFDDDFILVKYDGLTCALGVFPVTIKNEDFLELANDDEVKAEAKQIRIKIFGEKANSENDENVSKKGVASVKGEIDSENDENVPGKDENASGKGKNASENDEIASEKDEISSEKSEISTEKGKNASEKDGFRLFFSAERFDYTKGIRSKLKAFGKYLRNHPERRGKDVLFQLAVINRREVDSYRYYQDECEKIKNNINREFEDAEKYPNWKPIILKTEKFDRRKLIAHYLAMDVGVVTPRMDGMNLVSKEMLLCNPKAALILSVGAGSEYQFQKAGLYDKDDPNYFRVENIHDPEEFPEIFYQAAIQSPADRLRHGMVLNKFIQENNIERWSKAFLDPEWSPINLLKKRKPKHEKFKTNNELLCDIYG